jgi:hypothetical protein
LYISHLPHTGYDTYPTRFILLHHPNNSCWRVQTVMLRVMWFFPSCYFLSLRSKHFLFPDTFSPFISPILSCCVQ